MFPGSSSPRALFGSLLGGLLLGGCGGKEEASSVEFRIDRADLGAPVVSGVSYVPGGELGAALDAAAPVFGAYDPAWSTVQEVWEILGSSLIQDEGTCPQPRNEGDSLVYVASCRSSDGYEWDGEVEVRETEADDGVHERFTAELMVIGDVEGAKFSSIVLRGAIERVTPSDPTIAAHVDVNMEIQVDGYWEIHGPADPRLVTWADWGMSGTVEGLVDGSWGMDFTADIGGSGAFPFSSDALEDDGGCPVEVRGEANLGEGEVAVFGDGCDRCAVVDGVEVCAP